MILSGISRPLAEQVVEEEKEEPEERGCEQHQGRDLVSQADQRLPSSSLGWIASTSK